MGRRIADHVFLKRWKGKWKEIYWLFILTLDLLFVQNREMHDQIEYFLGGERSNSYLSSERNPQIVYR